MFKKFRKNKTAAIAMLLVALLFSSCGNKGPETILLNKDACSFCKMTISDARFMAEIVTKKGRVHKFDDLICMMQYSLTTDKSTIDNYYVGNYEKQNELLEAGKAWYVPDSSLKSPMGGNIAAFATKPAASSFAETHHTSVADWSALNNKNTSSEENHDGHKH